MRWWPRIFGKPGHEVLLAAAQQLALVGWQALPENDLQGRHAQTRYVVVDVESSGLNLKKDRLISIGAVAVSDGRMDFSDTFQVVLRQEVVSTHANILIHGIGGSEQSAGVEPVEALLDFLNYVGKAPLVAYNAIFDRTMIDKAMLEYIGMKPDLTWIDLAWIMPDLFRQQIDALVPLDSWLKLFSIESILRHNALSDAYATAKLLQIAIARGTQKGIDSPAALIKLERAKRWMHQHR